MRCLLRRSVLCALAASAFSAAPAAAATFLVSSNADSGAATLRKAIMESNATAGNNTIEFGFSNATTINLASPLPTITNTLSVNGVTLMGTPLVTIDGSALPSGQNCLTVNAKGSTVFGLSVVGCPGAGISVTSPGNFIEGDWLGVMPTGTAAGNGTGLQLTSGATGNFLGNATAPNVISGNTTGVSDSGGSNHFDENRIGTTITGTAAIANGVGVKLQASSDSLEGNVISGNTGDGINVIGGSENMIGPNKIGTDVSGGIALPNGGNGLTFSDGSDKNLVGGTDLASAPVISGNGLDGIWLVGASDHNAIDSALLGTAANGTTPLGNGRDGISIEGSSNTGIGLGDAPIAVANNAGFGVSSNTQPTTILGDDVSVFDNAGGEFSLPPTGLTQNGPLIRTGDGAIEHATGPPNTTLRAALFGNQSSCESAQTPLSDAGGTIDASGNGSLEFPSIGALMNPSALLTNEEGTIFAPCLTVKEPPATPMTPSSPTVATPTPVAPEAKPCACAKLTVFLNHFHTSEATGSTRIEFDVNWTMTCSAGTGNCNGRIKVLAPNGASFIEQDGEVLPKPHPRIITIHCPGPCAKTITGKETVAYLALVDVKDKRGKTHTVPIPRFTPKGRAGKSFEIRLSVLCTNPLGEIIKLKVAFNKHGQVDYKESSLLGPGSVFHGL